MPGGEGPCREMLDKAYKDSLESRKGWCEAARTGDSEEDRPAHHGRANGTPQSLQVLRHRCAGDTDPDEFFSAMHAFGLEWRTRCSPCSGTTTQIERWPLVLRVHREGARVDFYKQDPEDTSASKAKTAVLARCRSRRMRR